MVITLGVDIGGTFTDFVWAGGGTLRVLKLPTTPAQEEGFLAGLERLPTGKIGRIVHGTTVATNALLKGKWARTTFITTAGSGTSSRSAARTGPPSTTFSVTGRRP